MFFKKFIQSFLAIIGYMVFMAVIGLPFFLFQKEFDEKVFTTLVIVWIAAIIVSFFPFLLWVTGKIWFFKSQDVPVELSELKKQLLEINQFDIPIVVQETKKGGLNFTWKYVEAKWWELLAKAGLKKTYELRLRFNEKKHEVIMIDVSKSFSWRVGLTSAHIGWFSFRGVQVGFELGKQWGVKENFSLGKVYDFKFNPSEIKTPVMNTVLKNGWNVRFGIF